MKMRIRHITCFKCLGVQVHVVESRSGEIISLEQSSIGEVLYNAQGTQTWLLDFDTTFNVTSNIERLSDYLAEANDTVRLGDE